jgi:hypothetical protein
MCLTKIFKNLPQSTPLPYPEEPVDDSLTTKNTNASEILQKWLIQRQVPAEYRDFWKSRIDIRLYDAWPADMLNKGIKADAAACTWTEHNVRIMASLTRWFNVGVIAHEQAHNSYALLPRFGRCKFFFVYNLTRRFDPLIKLLYSKNQYGLQSTVEGHAEVYRYLGDKMPDRLKKYYPKLF